LDAPFGFHEHFTGEKCPGKKIPLALPRRPAYDAICWRRASLSLSASTTSKSPDAVFMRQARNRISGDLCILEPSTVWNYPSAAKAPQTAA
jgi:hypothetical protein